MELRDSLAIQRTVLANQRTLLTFFNTSLALVVSGFTLIKFFSGMKAYYCSCALLLSGALLLSFGFKNYFVHKRKIEAAYKTSL